MSLPPETPSPDLSANATTHGLTARRPICEVEHERMQVIYNDWVTKLHPETEDEEALVSTAAIEYVRYVRCVRAGEARLRPAARAAVLAWTRGKQKAVRKLAQGLYDYPSRVVAELEESGFGIDWMTRHWSRLLAMLDTGQCPTGMDFDRAVNLMGLPSMAERVPGSELATFWNDVYAAFPALTLQPGSERIRPDRAALGRLKSLISARIARLEAIRPIAWESSEAEELESVEADATSDISKEGQLRHRYRRDAQRDYQKSLAQLDRLRSDRSKTHARESKLMASAPPDHQRPAWTAPKADAVSSPEPAPSRSPNEPRNPASPAGPIRPNSSYSNLMRDALGRLSPDAGGRTDGRTGGRTADPADPDSPAAGPSARPEPSSTRPEGPPDPR